MLQASNFNLGEDLLRKLFAIDPINSLLKIIEKHPESAFATSTEGSPQGGSSPRNLVTLAYPISLEKNVENVLDRFPGKKKCNQPRQSQGKHELKNFGPVPAGDSFAGCKDKTAFPPATFSIPFVCMLVNIDRRSASARAKDLDARTERKRSKAQERGVIDEEEKPVKPSETYISQNAAGNQKACMFAYTKRVFEKADMFALTFSIDHLNHTCRIKNQHAHRIPMSKEDFDFLVHAILTHPTLADVWNDVIRGSGGRGGI
jgi:hypothetical protein